jgi:hypothetical protein
VCLSYFFCEDELSAELVCLFQKLAGKGKEEMIIVLIKMDIC